MDEKTEEYIKGYARGVSDLAERLKNYYSNLRGTTPAVLTAYNIETAKKEILEKMEGD